VSIDRRIAFFHRGRPPFLIYPNSSLVHIKLKRWCHTICKQHSSSHPQPAPSRFISPAKIQASPHPLTQPRHTKISTPIMHSAILTIALIISVTCGLVTAQFAAEKVDNFSCPNKPHVEGHCIYTRYNTPNHPKSGVEYYVCKSSFSFNS
jgi:hypothetical protein